MPTRFPGGVVIDAASADADTVDGQRSSAIADLTAITGGESPTEAEHNAVVTAVNAILAALRKVGVVAE